MFQMLEKLDIFGVPIKLKTLKQEEAFRTSQSGIITLIIMILSLLYFCYVISLWIGGQLMPKVTFSQSMIDYSVYEWDNRVIAFTLYDISTQINPFTMQNNIIMPVLLEISGVYITAVPKILFSNESLNDGHKSNIYIDSGKLVLSSLDDDSKPLVQYMLFFTRCRADWMPQGGYCADEQTMNDYFTTDHGLLFLSVKLQQYNFTSLAFDEIQKTQFFAFEEDTGLYSQVILQEQKTLIDNGILLSNNKEYTSLKDFQINNQMVTDKFAKSVVRGIDGSEYQFAAFCTFVFRIDNIQGYEMISMPKLGEVLAQIGSIVNLIMLLKILANFINVTLLENSTLHQIIEIYYPEMKQVTIVKNLFGQVKQVIYKGQDIKINLFLHQYNELKNIAKQKFTFNNLIYEISRVQLILIQQFGMQIVKNTHHPLEELKFSECDSLIRQSQNMNLVAISPEESPRQSQFERFTLFNYNN